MTTTKEHVSPEELAERVRTLPPCIIQQAFGESVDDYAAWFWYKTNVAGFGERYVRLAGLLVAAVYLHCLRKNKKFSRDPMTESYIASTVFESGYNLGMACAIVQRAKTLQSDLMQAIVDDDGPVASFLSSLIERPSNRLRSDRRLPIESKFKAMLDSLSFISKFQFLPDASVLYDDHPIEVVPFLLWDGAQLRLLDRVLISEDLNHTIVLSDFTDPDTSLRQPVNGQVLSRLDEIAGRLNIDTTIRRRGPAESRFPTTSLIPNFADTHPQMGRLAQMFWAKAENSTKRYLWLPDGLKNPREVAEEFLASPQAEIFVTNQIIRKCLDEDPISVLEEYLMREQGDIDEYITELSSHKGEAEQICNFIEERTSERRNMLGAFFCRQRDKASMESHLQRYYTRIAAQEIVKLMGFTIIDVPMEEDITHYVDRARAFKDFLQDDFEDHNGQKVGNGILACAKAAERILQFLYLFYKSLPLFTTTEPDGVTAESRAKIRTIHAETHGKGLAFFLSHFSETLNDDPEIKRTLNELLERDSIWPAETGREIFSALWELNDVRIELVHDEMSPGAFNKSSVPTIKKAQSLVHGFQLFLDWLRNPTGAINMGAFSGDTAYPLRIYPEIVALHLRTTTRSGITSVRYILRDINDGRSEVRLYTSQHASVDGCYYGLPHSKKVSRDLWVNPILIKTDVLVGV